MSKLRVASVVMAVLFFICVGLQYNDPDPVQWMLIYGAGGIVAAWHARRGRVPVLVSGIVGVAALAWGIYVAGHIHGKFEWHHLAESMHAETPQIEESRESLGLFIVAAWMAVVAAAWRGPRPASAPSTTRG